jgi:hypothetical protein
MTSEEVKNIFKEGKKKMKSLRLTAISIDYQKQLKEVLEFNDKAIGEMKMKLMPLYTLQRWTHIFGAAAVQVAAAVGNVAH